MRKSLFLALSLFTAVASQQVLADFSLDGTLKAVDPRGSVIERDMPMAFNKSGDSYRFKIGKFDYKVPSRPEKYSIALVLQETNFVWIQEFNKRPIKSFEWNLGDHKIALFKQILKKPVKGDYILSIDDKDYFFRNRLAQITFIYNDEGIETIEVDGMVASIGVNRAKDETECTPDEGADGSGDSSDNNDGNICKPENKEETESS